MPSHALQISPAQPGLTLTPAQKRFNSLIRQIEQARTRLQAWQHHAPEYRQAYVQRLHPLQEELLAGHRQWVMSLDRAIARTQWTKAERRALRELLCDAAADLLGDTNDDPEIKALFDKHAEVDFDTEQRERARAMKGVAEALTGLDLGGDEGLDTDADLLARLAKSIDEQIAAEQAQRDAPEAPKRRGRPARAQQQREAEAQQATQSVREIYRKLASALHPDRETDEGQRDAKTALMQRANQAYEAQDLLALLELQLQVEQIDASHVAGVGEQRLKHYNKVLADQLAELKNEVERVELEFHMEYALEPGPRLDPHKLGRLLEQIHHQWTAERVQQKRDLRMLDDVAATKRWLKQRRDAERGFAFPVF